MHKKYDIEVIGGKNRIKALVDIEGVVRAGQYGGIVDNEENLSHFGKCWISEKGKALGNSRVIDDALIVDSTIKDRAVASHASKITNGSIISGQSKVSGSSEIVNSKIQGTSKIGKLAKVIGATVKDNASVTGQSRINNGAVISGNSKVYDYGFVDNRVTIHNCDINGYAALRTTSSPITINSTSEYASIKTSGSVFGAVTYIKGGTVVFAKRPIHQNNLVFQYDQLIGMSVEEVIGHVGVREDQVRKLKNVLRSLKTSVEEC